MYSKQTKNAVLHTCKCKISTSYLQKVQIVQSSPNCATWLHNLQLGWAIWQCGLIGRLCKSADRQTHVVMSAICIFGVVSLFSVRVLYFSCCSLLSVEDEFLLSWDFRYYCVKNKKSFPFRWISSCCEESLANSHVNTGQHYAPHYLQDLIRKL